MPRKPSPKWIALAASACTSATALAQIAVYNDATAFMAATGASSATGPLPDLGFIVSTATVGSITFSLAPGGDNFAIGGAGIPGLPTGDWYPETPGNDIAMGYENLKIDTDGLVYSLGFEISEPNVTMPEWGGSPQDSTYRVTLYVEGVQFQQFTFNVPDDVPGAFVGVWSSLPFNGATIVDITGTIFDDDDEYFGQFFTGTTPRPPTCYADCDGVGGLTGNDFQCFLNAFVSGDPYADCDHVGGLTGNDFQCFLNNFVAGCP